MCSNVKGHVNVARQGHLARAPTLAEAQMKSSWLLCESRLGFAFQIGCPERLHTPCHSGWCAGKPVSASLEQISSLVNAWYLGF